MCPIWKIGHNWALVDYLTFGPSEYQLGLDLGPTYVKGKMVLLPQVCNSGYALKPKWLIGFYFDVDSLGICQPTTISQGLSAVIGEFPSVGTG